MDIDMTRWKTVSEVTIPKRSQEGFADNILIREKKILSVSPPETERQVVLEGEIDVDSESPTILLNVNKSRSYLLRNKTGERIELANECVLGKSKEGTTYQIQGNPLVSRQHARIYKREEAFYIEDLNSSNGTTMAGQRICGPQKLEADDTFILADEYFTFLIER